MESLFFSKYQIDEDANKAKSREDLVHYSLAAFGEFIQLINEIDFFKGNSSKLFSAALMSFLYVIIDMKKNFVGAIWHPSSFRFLVAIVVPDEGVIKKWFKQNVENNGNSYMHMLQTKEVVFYRVVISLLYDFIGNLRSLSAVWMRRRKRRRRRRNGTNYILHNLLT